MMLMLFLLMVMVMFQVYAAERPCKGCDMNMTKVHTQHWEGGQGCRDKITMSRSVTNEVIFISYRYSNTQ